MMTRERADIGFDDDLDDFDPAQWVSPGQTRPRPEVGQARLAAEATGFRSREAAKPAMAPEIGAGEAPPKPQQRRRRTGRNAQFNLKARPDTIASFCAIADAKGWGLGETLEHAVALLQREYAAKDPA